MKMRGLRLASVLALGLGALCLASMARADDKVKDKPSSEKGAEKATGLDGEIVGTKGDDQLIIRTPDGKEITVYVNPKTKIMLENKEKKFSDLQKGAHIGVQYDERDQRYYANNIQDVSLLQGQIVKVIGKDQVVVKTKDGKEVIVYVDPQTRYLLTDEGGAFTDLQPGANINVYYGVRDDRQMARRIWAPRKR